MKTSDEYRATAWKKTREGRWTLKFLTVWMALAAFYGVVESCWKEAVERMGIQTWTMFFEAKAKAMASGLDLAVPSRAMALRMCEASAFEAFVGCIFSGLVAFAVAGLFLRAAKDDGARWFLRALGGFRYPLDVAWLHFRYVLQVLLWSLLLVVPGVIAAYRYCQCWNLKVEHPDWSAGRCLSESGLLMRDRKWSRFALDCSFWKPITLLMLGFLGLALLGALPLSGVLRGVGALVLSVVCCWGAVALGAWMSISQALFYLDLHDRRPLSSTPDESTSPAA